MRLFGISLGHPERQRSPAAAELENLLAILDLGSLAGEPRARPPRPRPASSIHRARSSNCTSGGGPELRRKTPRATRNAAHWPCAECAQSAPSRIDAIERRLERGTGRCEAVRRTVGRIAILESRSGTSPRSTASIPIPRIPMIRLLWPPGSASGRTAADRRPFHRLHPGGTSACRTGAARHRCAVPRRPPRSSTDNSSTAG